MPAGQYRLDQIEQPKGQFRLSDIQAEQPAESPGFFAGVGQTLSDMIPNPVAAVKEYINRPSEYGAAFRGMTAALKERRGEVTPETGAAIEEGLAANVQLPGSGADILPPGGARAWENAQQGNYAAAAGNMAALPLAAAGIRMVPPLVRGAGNAARAGVRAIQAPGALDMAAGAGEMAAGVGSTMAGHPFIGTGLAVRGATQFKKGMEARAAARAAAAKPPVTATEAVELTAHEQSLIQAVVEHPDLYRDLTKAARTKLIPELKRQGFTAFGKSPKATPSPQPPSSHPEPLMQAGAAAEPPRIAPFAPMPKPAEPVSLVTAEEAAAAGELSLEEAMQRSLQAVKARKAGQSEEVVAIPHKAPEFEQALYETSARGEKVGKLAKLLHEHGIPYADAKEMNLDHWKMLAKAAGVPPPSVNTIRQTLFEVNKLEKRVAAGAGSTAQKVRVN